MVVQTGVHIRRQLPKLYGSVLLSRHGVRFPRHCEAPTLYKRNVMTYEALPDMDCLDEGAVRGIHRRPEGLLFLSLQHTIPDLFLPGRIDLYCFYIRFFSRIQRFIDKPAGRRSPAVNF